ncbi:Crp/Fnr family transcriptional regulator [Rhizobium sp. BK251]|uniref:Crp/Fnr family transcriptional regulator n=1 Tax=Rhizobium sp. BK251 TaxID=2512125 RepID=UPI001049314F|nr:Crp/Fnr family transcriptional regulator [Rhizobium sp. BK251]TCL66375.1 CRP-like cAMP-binding protein [Rhizobium sp. BK251]
MLNVSRTIVDQYGSDKSDYFATLGADLTDKLLKTRVVKNYVRGNVISYCDEPLLHILLIQSGVVKVLACLLDGREFVVDTLKPGSLFGEVDVFRPTCPSFEVHAISACEIWALDGKVIKEAIVSDPELSARLLCYVASRNKALEDRLVGLTSVSIPSRLANTLLRLWSGEEQSGGHARTINISQHELASMLPASREKVNRCLREWERGNIIDLSPGAITITDPQALSNYVGCLGVLHRR